MFNVKVVVKKDLCARDAVAFSQKASELYPNILIKKNDRIANAKSVLGTLSLGLKTNDVVEIMVDGKGEDKVLSQLESFIGEL